jgi:cell division initiation protein
MKITPLEIRQKTFEKKMRGYDKDEVNAFLLSLSREWEQVQDEIKELKINYQNSVKEVKQLREVESSLYKTLKTAEDTGANLIDQANKTAELHLRETQMNADGLLNEAKSKARSTIEDADMRARQIVDKMEGNLQELSMEFRGLENLRDLIIAELRNLSNDTLKRIDKLESNANKVDLSKKPVAQTEIIKDEVVKKPVSTANKDEINADNQPEEVGEETISSGDIVEDKVSSISDSNDDEESSFFDQIK